MARLPIRTSPAQPIHTHAIAFGDVNGDGHLDVVVGNERAANQLLIGDGNGAFADQDLPGGSRDTYAIAFGDVNGDGHLDVVVGNSYGSQPAVDRRRRWRVCRSGPPGGSRNTSRSPSET